MARRCLSTAGVVLMTFAFMIAATSPASANADNVVLVLNTTDDSYQAKQRLRITRTTSTTVDQGNVAWAEASCSACTTIAVAVQVILVSGDANVVTPKNLAVAINNTCTSCATLADAYQYLVMGDGPMRFTDTGSARLDQIRTELDALFVGEPDIFAVHERVAALMLELEEVLRDEIVTVGTASVQVNRGTDTSA